MNIIILVFMYIAAAGLAARIYLFKKTGDSKYKHNYCCWFSGSPATPGKHEKSKHTKP